MIVYKKGVFNTSMDCRTGPGTMCCTRLAIMRRFGAGTQLQLFIGTLNMSRLGRPRHQNWPMPELDSRIKAGKTRSLFAFTAMMMTLLAHESPTLDSPEKKLHAQIRAVCCWSLDVALTIWSLNKKVVTEESVVRESTWLCRLHCATYQWLASACMAQRRLLYKIRPKTHYFIHMVDHHDESRHCPMFLSTFGDEDFMHKVRGICCACHGRTYTTTWARRYSLKRSLQWRQIKKGLARHQFIHQAFHEHSKFGAIGHTI